MSTTGRIRGLILDYGEVIANRPAAGAIGRLAHAAGLDPETFAARYHGERDPYDRGDFTPADYWSRVLPGIAPTDGLLGKLREWDVEMWSDINPDMTAWLGELHAAGFKTALLSNMHPDMALHVRRSFGWFRHLDCAILSCEVRLIKPSAAIYQRCLECLALPASETCFIDDREVNVQGAREVGITGLRFSTIESLRHDLTALGLTVLPRASSAAEAAGE